VKKGKNIVELSHPRLETVMIRDIIEHPDQRKYFRAHAVYAFAALKEDIAEKGIKEPPHVIPIFRSGGKIACQFVTGHTRTLITEVPGITALLARAKWAFGVGGRGTAAAEGHLGIGSQDRGETQ
jgi:hypothetical protein